MQSHSSNTFNFSLSSLASFPILANMNKFLRSQRNLYGLPCVFLGVAFLPFLSLLVNSCSPWNTALFPLNSCVIGLHCPPQRELLKVISDLLHVLQVFWSSTFCDPLHDATLVPTLPGPISALSPLPYSGPPLTLLGATSLPAPPTPPPPVSLTPRTVPLLDVPMPPLFPAPLDIWVWEKWAP